MLLQFENKKVYGWGRSTFSNSKVFSPTNIEEVQFVIEYAKNNNLKLISRGSGTSYGDNTLNDNQIVIDLSNLNKIINWNPTEGILTTEAGFTIEQILIHCTSSGWLLPTIPGTRFVSLAGALSNNVHGKNEFHRGCIGEYTEYFKTILSNNEIYKCSRTENSELFYSIISGSGLIGIIVEISLKLRKIPSYYVSGKVQKFPSFNKLVEGYENIKHQYEYSIAWVDAIKRGDNLGRGEINYANFIDDGDFKIRDHEIPNRMFGVISNDLVPYLAKLGLNTYTMRIVNWLQSNTGNMSSDVQVDKVSLSKFIYLMDMKFPNYNYFFRHGFFHYQPVLPIDNCIKGYQELLEITHKYGFYSFMSALKAYRSKKEDFLLHFPLDGYSFTMDIPKNKNQVSKQIEMFYKMNDVVIKFGGRIYLGKTPVLNYEHFKEMYKNLDQFLMIKDKYDPINLFESNMFRRIMGINHENVQAPLETSI